MPISKSAYDQTPRVVARLCGHTANTVSWPGGCQPSDEIKTAVSPDSLHIYEYLPYCFPPFLYYHIYPPHTLYLTHTPTPMPSTTTASTKFARRPALAAKTMNISNPMLAYEPFLDFTDLGKNVRPLREIPGAVPSKAQPKVQKRQRTSPRLKSEKLKDAEVKAAVLKVIERDAKVENAPRVLFKDARRQPVKVKHTVKHQPMCAVVGVWEDQFPAPEAAPSPAPEPIPTADSWLCGEFPSLFVDDVVVKQLAKVEQKEVSPRSSTETLVESVVEEKPTPAPAPVAVVVNAPFPTTKRPALTLIALNIAQARSDIKYRPECFESLAAPPKQTQMKRTKSMRWWKKAL